MADWTEELIRRHTRPMKPIPTEVTAAHETHFPLRAILWDVYGTLLISGVGDVGVSTAPEAAAAEDAFAACGTPVPREGQRIAQALREAIVRSHADQRERGIEHPEVVIEQIWDGVRRELVSQQVLPASAGDIDAGRISLEYELRVNPVWPMPHARDALAALAAQGFVLGIISNAQWFTPRLLEELLGGALADLGFARADLRVFSFEAGCAKPSGRLFQIALDGLREDGILPQETMYVGNDMLNDCWGAAQAGMRTALFAGDRRSLRWREGDPRVSDLRPDWVVTELKDFASAACRCFPPATSKPSGGSSTR